MSKKFKEEEKNTYSAESIQILENIEAVRKRPGMYVGSTDEDGWHHLFQEVIDNSIDEAVAGHCSEIKVVLSPDQRTIGIKDNGRGIPIEIHPESKKSTLLTIFTVLHSGGKFDDKVYTTSGGLHGVGVTVVNALSKKLEVWSTRRGKTEYLEFRKGILFNSKIEENPKQDTSGITISFSPDEEIFKEFTHFKIDVIRARLEDLSYLNPYVQLTFFSSPIAEPIIYHHKSGIAGWVRKINGREHLPNSKVFSDELMNNEKNFYLNISFQYNNYQKKIVKSFCNNISTLGGGTHVDGFENGLLLVLKDWIKEKNPNLKTSIIKEDVTESLTAVISIRMKDPQFAGQTKDKLDNKFVRDLVKSATYDLVKKFLQDDKTTADAISNFVITNSHNRTKTEEYRKSLGEGSRGAVSPEKLAPCISKESEGNELFIVEGESAGGSAKLARDPFNQAVLPLQGKIINVKKSEKKKVINNKEIINLINSLGLSVNEATNNYYTKFSEQINKGFLEKEIQLEEEFSYTEEGENLTIPIHKNLTFEQLKKVVEKNKELLLKKLRYGKVIIMTDADPDGKHIECLILAFLFEYFRYLIEAHKVYLAIPPLYRLQSKKETIYLYSDDELEKYREQHGGNLQNFRLQRFKGLGEMNPAQLRETTMNMRKRCLHGLIFDDYFDVKRIIEELMGSESQSRKKRLESGEHKKKLLVPIDNKIDIAQAMLTKFLEYGYSVVEDRALPQLHDGLKPVQRRSLFTFGQLGLHPNKSPTKSAKIVGEVMGRFHPHGDSSIYQAVVKMSQNFHLRYPLIEGQGNWGSIDGDSAAAMRYTEAKLTKFGSYLLNDIHLETVDWVENYDNTEKEPKILPTSLNILLNGSSGIAVGMSTNIPPHNLSEVVDATIEIINNPNVDQEKIFELLPAPDFPTGGIILNKEEIKKIYEKGEGTIYVRSKCEITSSKKEIDRKDLIIVKEIPYKVNKSKLLESINKIIKSKKIEGIKSVHDYSNYEEIVNIHIKFDPDYDGEVILNQLYKSTELQSTFSVKMRALIGDNPRIFSVREILEEFIKQRSIHVQKKALFINKKNEKELANLEIKKFIIDNYQEIAKITKEEVSEEEIKRKLKERFSLTDDEIEKILDTPSSFRQFTSIRRSKLEEDINYLCLDNEKQKLLINEEEQRKIKIIEELKELKKDYIDNTRRTKIVSTRHSITERELIPPHEQRLVILSNLEEKKEKRIFNFITINQTNSLEPTNIPSVGKSFRTRGENWSIMKVFRRDSIWCFSNSGRIYEIKFYENQFSSVDKIINLDEEYFSRKINGRYLSLIHPLEFFTAALSVNYESEKKYLLLLTQKGQIKKVDLKNLKKIGRGGKRLMNLNKKEKCSEHNLKIEEHKNSDCCDKSLGIEAYSRCEFFKEIQKEIRNCAICNNEGINNDNKIIRAELINGNEEIYAIIKRKKKEGRIDNLKYSLFNKVRKKDDNGKKIFCEIHLKDLSEHKEKSHLCGISCSLNRKIRSEIKNCLDCQNPKLFEKQLKKRIKCESVVDLLIDDSKNNDSLIFLIREDKSCEKKHLAKLKTFLCSDNKQKRTIYCKKHWEHLENVKNNINSINEKVQEKKHYLEKEIVNSSLLEKELKEKFLVQYKFQLNEDIRKRINNYPLEGTRNKEAIDNNIKSINEIWNDYRSLLIKKKTEDDKLKSFQEIKNSCPGCQSYCDLHGKNFQDEKHSDCHYCGKAQEKVTLIEEEINNLQEKIDKKKELQLTNKIVNKLTKELETKKREKKEVNRSFFTARVNCPVLNEIKLERKNCPDCYKKIDKKFITIMKNSLNRVFLITNYQTRENLEIYLLSNELICWYNKNDLVSFVRSDENKTKSLLKDKRRRITDIKFY